MSDPTPISVCPKHGQKVYGSVVEGILDQGWSGEKIKQWIDSLDRSYDEHFGEDVPVELLGRISQETINRQAEDMRLVIESGQADWPMLVANDLYREDQRIGPMAQLSQVAISVAPEHILFQNANQGTPVEVVI
jgi:hypothetical protein